MVESNTANVPASEEQLVLFHRQAAMLERHFLESFRGDLDAEVDIPAVWGFQPAASWADRPLAEFDLDHYANYDWLVTFYCEAPGQWHAEGGPHERMAAGCELTAKLPQYARWLLPRFQLRAELIRRLPSLRAEAGFTTIRRHVGILLQLAALADDDQITEPAHVLLDTYRYNCRPLDETAPPLGGLRRTLTAEGRYRWLCPQHAAEH